MISGYKIKEKKEIEMMCTGEVLTRLDMEFFIHG